MNFLGAVTSLVSGGERRIHECRCCGTTLVRRDDPCPYCGPTDVETFTLGG
jgi:rubrerythrin